MSRGTEGCRLTLMLVPIDGVVYVFWVFKSMADHCGGEGFASEMKLGLSSRGRVCFDIKWRKAASFLKYLEFKWQSLPRITYLPIYIIVGKGNKGT